MWCVSHYLHAEIPKTAGCVNVSVLEPTADLILKRRASCEVASWPGGIVQLWLCLWSQQSVCHGGLLESVSSGCVFGHSSLSVAEDYWNQSVLAVSLVTAVCLSRRIIGISQFWLCIWSQQSVCRGGLLESVSSGCVFGHSSLSVAEDYWNQSVLAVSLVTAVCLSRRIIESVSSGCVFGHSSLSVAEDYWNQ